MSSKAQVTEAAKLNRITKKKQNCKEGKIYMQDQLSYPMCQGNCGKLYKIKSDMWLRLVLKWTNFQIQSTLVISKSKGPSETLRDIRTSTYQICSIEDKII